MIQDTLIQPFLDAAHTVFKTMVFVQSLVPGESFLKAWNKQPKADISGSIGLAGKLNGVMALTFSEAVACRIAGSMLGEVIPTINDTVKDSVGEITNMVAGNAKLRLSESQWDFKIALPSVIVGRDHVISYPGSVPCVVIPLNIPEWNAVFYLELCLKT